MYNNDSYRYAWDRVTQTFYIINPYDCIIFGSKNPLIAFNQYETYVSVSFRKRIQSGGYNYLGEKTQWV